MTQNFAYKRRPEGDWPNCQEPGGCECDECGCIFIGYEGQGTCRVCWESSMGAGANTDPATPSTAGSNKPDHEAQ